MAIPEGLLSWLWVAAAAVVAPAVLGLGILRALGVPRTTSACAAWAHGYVAGQLVLAHVTAAWLWCGRPLPGVALPAAALLTGLVLARRGAGAMAGNRTGASPATPRERLPRAVALAAALTVAATVHACVVAAALPVRYGDEAEIWAAKAKVLYGGAATDFGLGLAMVGHADYPNLNPLAQVLAFAASGRVLHFENRLPIQAFGVALLLLLAAATALRARTGFAALAVLACGATLHTGIGSAVYADVPLACAVLATVDALLRWRATGERAWWRTACLAASATLALKNEGAMLVLAIAAAAVLQAACTRRTALAWPAPRRDAAWLLVPVSTVVLHRVFNAMHGLHNDLLAPGAGGDGMASRLVHNAASRGPDVAAAFGAMLVDPGPHRLLPLVALGAALAATLAAGRRWLAQPAAFVAGVAALGMLGYMLVFVSTPADLTWHLATAAARTLEHVVPLAALAACTTLAPRAAPA